MSVDERPLISICLITYNHSKYIAQAIEGVLFQEVNFQWELIIADDHSTDGTKEILLEYKSKYPDKIRLILQERNVGAAQNWLDLVENPAGKYIAYFEGDDYWVHPLKLQRQVDFLEQNPDYTICFHRVYELEYGGLPVLSSMNSSDTEQTYTIYDLASNNFMHTPSVVYRRKVTSELPSWFKLSPVGDYVLHMLNAFDGKIKYFPEPMAVYRKHVGIWSSQSQLKMWERWLVVLNLLINHFKEHDISNILSAQRDEIVTRILATAKQTELDIKNLKESPRIIASSITAKNLLAALKYKIADNLRSRR